MFASWQRHVEVVEALLSYEAQANSRDALGRTPLHWAVQPLKYRSGRFEDVFRPLAKAGASIDDTDNEGRTPMDIALKNVDKEAINILQEAKSEQNLS